MRVVDLWGERLREFDLESLVVVDFENIHSMLFSYSQESKISTRKFRRHDSKGRSK